MPKVICDQLYKRPPVLFWHNIYFHAEYFAGAQHWKQFTVSNIFQQKIWSKDSGNLQNKNLKNKWTILVYIYHGKIMGAFFHESIAQELSLTHNYAFLCQKIPEEILKESYQYIIRSRVDVQIVRKTTKVVHFGHILYVFLVGCMKCLDSLCISWDKFRVPITHTFRKQDQVVNSSGSVDEVQLH